MMVKKMRIILASSSPRRKELLRLIGLAPEILVPNMDEQMQPGESITDFMRRVTHQKAKMIYRDDFYDIPIIGADTIVALGQTIMGKPMDRQDAFNMLKKLANNVHEVVTGIAILYRGKTHFDLAVTKVYLTDISDAEIDFYLESGDYRDKAGAYGIQGKASVFIEKIEGCYFNVVGFPLHLFYKMLKKIGIEIYR